jgi:DNA-directed RNA polymerase subunit M/transcription elongation factor TFIIS
VVAAGVSPLGSETNVTSDPSPPDEQTLPPTGDTPSDSPQTSTDQLAVDHPLADQPLGTTPTVAEVADTKPSCRHEYVRIYQRKLKGLDRRLVATKAWLPVGFKITDFGHLGEGSYCFCTKCRTRLFPKRTNADRAQARLALAASKLAQAEAAEAALDESSDDSSNEPASIHVEELEIESVELADLEQGAVAIESEDTCSLPNEDA